MLRLELGFLPLNYSGGASGLAPAPIQSVDFLLTGHSPSPSSIFGTIPCPGPPSDARFRSSNWTTFCDRVLLLVGATALRTSDWEIPKCRAIRDGVTPALKAVQTALIFAWVNETATAFTRRRGEASADIAGFPPRRSCSRSTAAGNRSSSRS
jgi:hypothetical protein